MDRQCAWCRVPVHWAGVQRAGECRGGVRAAEEVTKGLRVRVTKKITKQEHQGYNVKVDIH